MRSHGMLFVYLFVFFLGLALCVGAAFMLLERDTDRVIRFAWLGGAGLIVAGYSIMQIFRPVPRRNSDKKKSD